MTVSFKYFINSHPTLKKPRAFLLCRTFTKWRRDTYFPGNQKSHNSPGPLEPRGVKKVPIIIKIRLFCFYVTSFAINKGQPSCQGTEWQGYNVTCQPLMFPFYEINFYTLHSTHRQMIKQLIGNRHINPAHHLSKTDSTSPGRKCFSERKSVWATAPVSVDRMCTAVLNHPDTSPREKRLCRVLSWSAWYLWVLYHGLTAL